MSKHGAIKRYFLVIEKIRRGRFSSFQEIKNYLFEYGFEIGSRTIQRDIEQIRFDFGIEIKYNRDKNGYYIDHENSLDIESFLQFLEIVSTAEIITESLLDSKNILKYISFDKGGGLKGKENLKPLFKAIVDRRQISFTHYNFHTEKSRKYSLNPYLLKEYQNRWYVIGTIEDFKEFRTFGTDRIENLEIMSETFKPNQEMNPLEIFKNTIELVYSENTMQTAVLSFTPSQGKYIKTLPLHASQRILLDDKNECRVSLDVIPNYELTHQILKYGETVKVIETAWLATEIKQIWNEQFKNTVSTTWFDGDSELFRLKKCNYE